MRPRLVLLLALLFAVLAPAVAQAQEGDTVAAPPRGRLVEPIAGVRVGFPQTASAYLGLAVVQKRYESGYAGLAVTVEPGLGGGMVGVGPTVSGGVGMIARVQGAVLRTWGDPWLVGPDRSYVGLDSRVSFGYIGISVGGYVRVPEDGDGPGVLLSANLVFGL